MGKRSRRIARKNATATSKKFKHVSGILSASASGFGFVNTPEESIFIPPKGMNRAIDGDVVEVAVTFPHDPKGPSGEIVKVLSREREFMVCEMTGKNSARSINRAITDEVRVCGSLKGAHAGDWVRLRLLNSGKKYTESLRGNVEENIGRANSVRGDLNAVANEFNMPGPYSEKMEADAMKLVPSDTAPRTDFPDLFCVTIDPADAKDFDDALSIESVSGKEWKIGVHIADVAAYVRPGTKFDKEARKRSFSSYIPGMFRPMLPKPLTSKMSLQEGQLSLAHSVFLRIRKRDGAVLGAERMFSRIVVRKRLNYDEVQDFFEGKKIPDWNAETEKIVSSLLKATGKMRACREKKEEFLHIETSEAHVTVDSEARSVTGLSLRSERRSDQLVEDCMLAANSAVAEEIVARKCAGLFRVHPEPDSERMDDFMLLAFSVLKRAPGDLTSRTCCNEFLKSLPDDHRRYVLTTAFLRTMARAGYAPDPGLHYGLGKSRYSHFTSPIRRYPDLVIHQQLHALDEKARLRSRATMTGIAGECSRREENNDNAYFAALDRLKLHFLKSRNALESNELYEGVIVKISPRNGWICDIPAYGLRGSVPMKYLPKTRRNPPKVGDLVYLVLDSLDFAHASAVFRPSI